MAGSVNKCILVGNLCADPEAKSFSNGGRVANFRLATNESWKDRQTGERKERVEYHSITIHGDGLVGIAEKYLRKGKKVYLEGKLQTRKWQDQSGNDRYSTEVVLNGPGSVLTMLDSGGQGGDGTQKLAPRQCHRLSGQVRAHPLSLQEDWAPQLPVPDGAGNA